MPAYHVCMATPHQSPQSPERRRLGALIEERRKQLRLSQDALGEEGGITGETVRRIIHGNRPISPRSKTGLERGLRWQTGSIDAILAGADPTPIDPPLPSMEDDPEEGLETFTALPPVMEGRPRRWMLTRVINGIPHEASIPQRPGLTREDARERLSRHMDRLEEKIRTQGSHGK